MLLDAAQQNTIHSLFNSDFLWKNVNICSETQKEDINNVSSVTYKLT